MALSPSGQFLYVADGGSNSVSVLDTRTNRVVASAPVGRQPVSVAVTPDGAWAYVANDLSGNATVINTRTGSVGATLPARGPFGVATSPNGYRAYATDLGVGKLTVIDTRSRQVLASPSLGGFGTDPFNTAVTNYAIYVTNQGAGTLSVLDPRSLNVVTTVNTGRRRSGHHPAHRMGRPPVRERALRWLTTSAACVTRVTWLDRPPSVALKRATGVS